MSSYYCPAISSLTSPDFNVEGGKSHLTKCALATLAQTKNYATVKTLEMEDVPSRKAKWMPSTAAKVMADRVL